jgi:hypothetical protein
METHNRRRNLHCTGFVMLIGIIKKPTLHSYFTTKRVISMPGFGDIIA